MFSECRLRLVRRRPIIATIQKFPDALMEKTSPYADLEHCFSGIDPLRVCE